MKVFICDDEPQIVKNISERVKIILPDDAELVTGKKIPIGRNYGEKAKVQLMRYMLK